MAAVTTGVAHCRALACLAFFRLQFFTEGLGHNQCCRHHAITTEAAWCCCQLTVNLSKVRCTALQATGEV
jgi:hypothetical protein